MSSSGFVEDSDILTWRVMLENCGSLTERESNSIVYLLYFISYIIYDMK